MTTSETAAALRDPIGDTGGRFTLDGATYMAGMNAGFAGLDLYVCGRDGVLGPVDADVLVDAEPAELVALARRAVAT